ncbi:MAG: DUF2156 domain-containing protein [Prevotellaceae bacterium]|nr:DUF2156 domain-containing protein [Prevotellaceae bacterium]
MIPFKDITPADRAVITAYTIAGSRRSCDYSFANMCSWRFLFGSRYALHEGFLLVKYQVHGMPTYMLPMGEGDMRAMIETLIADARAQGAPFLMSGICKEAIPLIEALLPGRFHFSTDRDLADYVYLRADLASLAGKKLQPKRNHVNKFKRMYRYEYTPITKERIPECLELEAEWCKANNCDQHEGTGNERRALEYALHHFDELGLTGGILHVEGRIVAFTFGSPVNHDTFDVHVEKADTAIEGAYAMINREFCSHIPQQYIYMNREEDLGIPGLRKAKLSYQPAMLIEKYVARLKEETGADTIAAADFRAEAE